MDLYTVLTNKYEERKQLLTVAMAQGAAKDFADYQYQCGRLRGLADAQIELNDLLREIKEKDED